MKILPYSNSYREQVIELTLQAWKSVFPKTKAEVPGFIYENFWPKGWELRQADEVATLLDRKPKDIWLAMDNSQVIGFVGLAIHPEDQMGEIVIVAVAPAHQKKGIGKALLEFAEAHIKQQGMKMIMVETVGDSGHEPARKAYEAQGYETWPVARYFKNLQ